MKGGDKDKGGADKSRRGWNKGRGGEQDETQ